MPGSVHWAGRLTAVTRKPGRKEWMTVTFYTLPDGSPYLDHGARATPEAS